MKQLKDSSNRQGIRIVFLGPSGSGKGTQSKLMSKRFSIPHISVGDILREEIEKASEFALQLKSIQDSGNLVPDEIVLQIIKKYITKQECANGYILDGFPRTLFQATELDKILNELNQQLTNVFYLDISPDEIARRLLTRLTCASCGNVFNLNCIRQ